MKFRSEKEMAGFLIQWLKDQKWEIYQEVSTGDNNPVADIVAIKDSISRVIETKLTLSLALIEQANNYKYLANYISIAIPNIRKVKGHRIAEYFLRQMGIGVLEVDRGYDYRNKEERQVPSIREILSPKLQRERLLKRCNIKNYLHEAQKNYCEAGSLNGYWSPFKQTCNNIKYYIKKHPGATLKELFNNVDHHYSSTANGKSSIVKWIEAGVIDGLRIERDGKIIKLYMEESKWPEFLIK